MNIKTLRLGLQKWLGRMKWVEQRKCLRRLKWRHWVLIALLLLITLTKTIPTWAIIYTFFVYPLIGMALSHLSGWIPFAVGDLFIALCIAWVILYPIYHLCTRKTLVRKEIIKKGIDGKGIVGKEKKVRFLKKRVVFGRVAEYLLWVYAWFYIAWGLNYSQPNIYDRTGMKPVKVSEAKFKAFAYQYADSLNALSISEKSFFSDSIADDGLKNRVWDAILKEYNKIGYKEGINAPFNQHPHAKTMVFTPISSMSGVTGSMGPFFCEFTLNGDILPHDYPATYAHEFAHFLGVANEGEANFYSYIVCTASADKQVRFSGYYHIFFHVIINVRELLGEEEFERFVSGLRPEIMALARNDREYWLALRSPIIDKTQTFFYNLYLKGNNVEEGLKSYSAVIGMIMAWNRQ